MEDKPKLESDNVQVPAAPVEESKEEKFVSAEQVSAETEIKDPYRFALAQKERADRLSKRLTEIESKYSELESSHKQALEERQRFVETRQGLETDIKRHHATMALKSAGVEDEELLGIFSEDLVKIIKLDDNFKVADATYLERAKILGTKTKASAKPINVLQEPAGSKTEEVVPKNINKRILYGLKKMNLNK